jgi:hypothetical protein
MECRATRTRKERMSLESLILSPFLCCRKTKSEATGSCRCRSCIAATGGHDYWEGPNEESNLLFGNSTADASAIVYSKAV